MPVASSSRIYLENIERVKEGKFVIPKIPANWQGSMAGNSLQRLSSWISLSIAILSEWLLLTAPTTAATTAIATTVTAVDRVPCAAHPSRQRSTQYRAEPDITLFLQERCEQEVNVMEIRDMLQRSTSGLTLDVTPRSLTCETETRGLEALIRLLGRKGTRTGTVVAGLDPDTCEIAAGLAQLWAVPLFTWTCPMKQPWELSSSSTMVRLSPSFPSLAAALVQVFLHLRWKSCVVIGIDREPWSSLQRTVTGVFRKAGIVIRREIQFGQGDTSAERLDHRLAEIRLLPRSATLLCLPVATDEATTNSILMELDKQMDARQANRHTRQFPTVLLYTEEDFFTLLPANREGAASVTTSAPISTIDSFLPSEEEEIGEDTTLNVPFPGPTIATSADTFLNDSAEAETFRSFQNLTSLLDQVAIPERPDNETNSSPNLTSPSLNNGEKRFMTDADNEFGNESETLSTAREMEPSIQYLYVPPKALTRPTLDNLLIFAPFDQRYDVSKICDGTEFYRVPTLLDRLNETIFILLGENQSIDVYKNKMYNYALIGWHNAGWRPILLAAEDTAGLSIRELNVDETGPAHMTFGSLSEDFECEFEGTVETDAGFGRPNHGCRPSGTDLTGGLNLRAMHIVLATVGSLLLMLLSTIAAVFIRRQLLKKRMSKGPYKIILTTSDFVFPQLAQMDSRRVDEGIETMLCCWLQQLQEFGGPEVEKPDLLQLGGIGSLRPYLQSSTGNLARHTFLKDPRARYNGDLVQLKELPCQGTFELKAKAMDVLVTVHGLRHENLNPLIGCLNEPNKPCLVYDYCSRGSLEDVLVQDEIKLDWSFRLSLLTDLVRGMRYLHGTPIRVHGSLTSRNCVIDARWVLKLTDYGLPAFYEAQGINMPTKTARDLLWTAPELLRNPGLRKKGTQPGDVYSFGIIMQEVVVRGEPFCMLALSPEDIIEKVMKPPPLIRPSVSKGAAPPEAINIMRQCWAEAPDMRPDFDDVHDLFKKLNHGRKVNFMDTMFQMLEKYSNNLEELIRERTEQLDMEKKKTEQLLNRMLPSTVAEKLKLGMPVDPEEFSEVTIYFSDIVGFTTISANSTPFQVVDLLNDLYTCFDATINAYTVYKVETIGDAYMVVGGCPVRIPDHASQIATMALDLLHQSGKFRLKHLPKTQLRLRIGLHTGPCCAGVVGLTMPRYCLFGDTVNTASRMESTGAPWRIHMSQATRDRLIEAGGYRIEYRGRTEVKGKGEMPTYWLLGKQGFDKELPTPPLSSLGEDRGLDERLLNGVPPKEEAMAIETGAFAEVCNASSAADVPTPTSILGIAPAPAPAPAPVPAPLPARLPGLVPRPVSAPAPAPATDSQDSVPRDQFDRKKTRQVLQLHQRSLTLMSPPTPAIAFDPQIDMTSEESTTKSRARSASLSQEDEEKAHGSNGTGKGTGIRSATEAAFGAFSGSCAIPGAGAIVSGVSTSSLTSLSSQRLGGPGNRYRRKPLYVDEYTDLSRPYNHYRCLSPNEHHGKTAGGGRPLRRQFSLDRADELPIVSTSIVDQQQRQQQRQQPRISPLRLYKQNSAGAANDLERIEEIPQSPGPALHTFRHAASISLSVESLSFR